MQQIPILTLSLVAAAAIPGDRFFGLDGQLANADEAAWGVNEFLTAPGKPAAVKVLGTAKVQVGAPVAPGQLVKSDAVGRAIPRGAAGAVLGRAITGSNNVDGVIEIFLLPTDAAA